NATGISLSVPMPGHPIPPSSLDSTRADFDTLETLVDEHDVVYLLMDSRESRWLPTVMGAAKGKLVMNVALGFDTFLAMRHGLPSLDSPSASSASSPSPAPPASSTSPFRGRLGCYYCNDVVAPQDSLTDRTLDQQCTVTRPGIAAIASATAVELMVSVLQHPLGAHAPSSLAAENDEAKESPLGLVPHQLRGFLARFETLRITGQAYDRCTGGSASALLTAPLFARAQILAAYARDPFALVRAACEDAKHLERLTGLDVLERETEALLAEGVDWAEESEGEGEEGW
ncbi:Autophagy protein 7, partial [Rhodotorula kratochvilovae]